MIEPNKTKRVYSYRIITEIIGLIAVIASLIFVGMEVRQNAKATRDATAQDITNGWLQWNLSSVDKELWQAWEVMVNSEDFEAEDFVNKELAQSAIRGLFQNWSNAHFHYLNGNLDKTLWDSMLRDMSSSLSPLKIWVWGKNKQRYHEDFQLLYDGLIKDNRDQSN